MGCNSDDLDSMPFDDGAIRTREPDSFASLSQFNDSARQALNELIASQRLDVAVEGEQSWVSYKTVRRVVPFQGGPDDWVSILNEKFGGKPASPVQGKRYPIRDDDSYEMKDAIRALIDRNIAVGRPTGNQLRLADRKINFYPSTGTIVLDGHSALQERGLDALLRVLFQPTGSRPRLYLVKS